MAKKAPEGIQVVCSNKKGRRDYHIEDTSEAGIVLRGSEVKSLREGLATLLGRQVILSATTPDRGPAAVAAHVPGRDPP